MRLTELDKPAHLVSETGRSTWAHGRMAGAVTLGLGLLSFMIVAMTSNGIGSVPDWRISVPAFVITCFGAVASIARKEQGAYPLWLLGLGLAGVAIVLGWFLIVAIVVAATAILMLILHAVM